MNLAPTNWRVRAVQEHLEQVIAERDALRADNERLAAKLHEKRGAYMSAVMERNRLQRELVQMREERASESPTIAHGLCSDASRSVLPRFLELARIERYVVALYDTEIEVDARLANRALAYVAELVAELERQRPGLKDRRRTA